MSILQDSLKCLGWGQVRLLLHSCFHRPGAHLARPVLPPPTSPPSFHNGKLFPVESRLVPLAQCRSVWLQAKEKPGDQSFPAAASSFLLHHFYSKCSLGSKWQSPGRNPDLTSISGASGPPCCLWRRQAGAQCQDQKRRLLGPRGSLTPGEGMEKHAVTNVASWPAWGQLQRAQHRMMESTMGLNQEVRPTAAFQLASVTASNASRVHSANSVQEYLCLSLDNK